MVRVPAAETPVRIRRRRGIRDRVKVLVLTPEPLSEPRLRAALGDDLRGAEILVVSPATNESRLAFWMSDPDQAIAEAHEAQARTVEALEKTGADAEGRVGESEPAVALEDAMALFPAERIVIATPRGQDAEYRSDPRLSEAEARFGVPVSWLDVDDGAPER